MEPDGGTNSSGLKKAVADGKIFPVFATAGQQLVGVASILDFVADYAPSPEVAPQSVGYKPGNSKEEIKVACNPGRRIRDVRLQNYFGKKHRRAFAFQDILPELLSRDDLFNQTSGKSERLGTLYLLNGKEREGNFEGGCRRHRRRSQAERHSHKQHFKQQNFPLELRKINFPEPIMRVAIISKNRHDEDKVASGLHALHEEDPTFHIEVDPELSQTVLSGQGEMHLQVVARRLKERYGVEVDMVEPDIPYRETIRGVAADSEYKHKKQSGGHGQYGHVHLKLEPMARGGGFEFVDAIVGGVVPGSFIPAVEKGIVDVMAQGVLSGHKVVDVKATLFDGTYHTVDSDEISFKIAASMAFRKGFKEAKPILLEPIYELEVVVPDEHMGDIMGDISGRRGKILGMEAEGTDQKIRAQVPLKELYKMPTSSEA